VKHFTIKKTVDSLDSLECSGQNEDLTDLTHKYTTYQHSRYICGHNKVIEKPKPLLRSTIGTNGEFKKINVLILSFHFDINLPYVIWFV
jgi:hypothetical protein